MDIQYILSCMNNLLKLFWNWIELTPQQYAEAVNLQKSGIMEDSFPYINELVCSAKEIIDKESVCAQEIDDLLTIMAIDNESESVLDYIKENSSIEQLNKIVEAGVNHIQPNARWQIAVLLFERRPTNFVEKLKMLVNDNNGYVKKRAGNCLRSLNGTACDNC